MDGKPIGVFDSGVGGLTVAAEVIKQLPNESIIYFGDTARFPYGPRSAEELKKFVFQIVEFLQREGVKFIVIACNSASSAALEWAQARFDTPIVGVVEPGAQAAVATTRTRRIGVIGTQATVSSLAYVKAVETFDTGAEVYQQACPDLADFVEQGETSGERIKKVITDYLKPIMVKEIDTLILGCTHYPLLSEAIKEVVGESIKLISSAEEAAREIKEILKEKGHLRTDSSSPVYRFISTGDKSKFLKLSSQFLGRPIDKVEEVSLE